MWLALCRDVYTGFPAQSLTLWFRSWARSSLEPVLPFLALPWGCAWLTSAGHFPASSSFQPREAMAETGGWWRGKRGYSSCLVLVQVASWQGCVLCGSGSPSMTWPLGCRNTASSPGLQPTAVSLLISDCHSFPHMASQVYLLLCNQFSTLHHSILNPPGVLIFFFFFFLVKPGIICMLSWRNRTTGMRYFPWVEQPESGNGLESGSVWLCHALPPTALEHPSTCWGNRPGSHLYHGCHEKVSQPSLESRLQAIWQQVLGSLLS